MYICNALLLHVSKIQNFCLTYFFLVRYFFPFFKRKISNYQNWEGKQLLYSLALSSEQKEIQSRENIKARKISQPVILFDNFAHWTTWCFEKMYEYRLENGTNSALSFISICLRDNKSSIVTKSQTGFRNWSS